MADIAAFKLICERIADGQSLREICRQEGMPSKSTVLRWLTERPELQDQYARAREMQADHFAEEILEISDDGSNDWMQRQHGEDETVEVVNHEHISRSKLRVDSRKWLMSKMLPKKYGDRLVHAGDEENPIPVRIDRIERVIVNAPDRDGGSVPPAA